MKKGEMSMSMIIMAVIAIIILVVIIFLVTGTGKDVGGSTNCPSKGGVCAAACDSDGTIYEGKCSDPTKSICCNPMKVL